MIVTSTFLESGGYDRILTWLSSIRPSTQPKSLFNRL